MSIVFKGVVSSFKVQGSKVVVSGGGRCQLSALEKIPSLLLPSYLGISIKPS